MGKYVPGLMMAWTVFAANDNTRWHWGSKKNTPEPAIPWCGLLLNVLFYHCSIVLHFHSVCCDYGLMMGLIVYLMDLIGAVCYGLTGIRSR